MKLILTLFVIAGVSLVESGQTSQNIQRYSYHTWGTVSGEQSRPIADLNVCWVPAKRPINGRIPCVKTGSDGSFAITVQDIPDEYVVCATTMDTPFKFVGDVDPTHRVTCSKPFATTAADECRKIDLKFGNAEK
jgi:hypothetical protein